MIRINFSKCVLCIWLLFASFTVFAADDQVDLSLISNEGISDSWSKVICGNAYKKTWYENRITGEQDSANLAKTHQDLIEDLLKPGLDPVYCDATTPDKNHVTYLRESLSEFYAYYNAYRTDSLVSGIPAEDLTEAQVKAIRLGLRESIAYSIEAIMLVANQDLINGLRRFRTDENEPRTHVELLGDSATQFLNIMESSLDAYILYPEVFTQTGDYLGLSGSVEVIDGYSGENKNIVVSSRQRSNDFMMAINLMNRYALAASSEAKYLFYKKNVQDVDHIPYKNFPGPEDLDINGDSIKNEAGRVDAANRAKKAGNSFYLQALAMNSQHSGDNFYNNNGFEVKRHLNDISRLYQDIQSGFNPLKLAGDFVPYQRVENFLNYASARIKAAEKSETNAKESERQFERNETQLRAEMLSQQERYLDQLTALTGLDPTPYVESLLTKEGREEYLVDADTSVSLTKGSIGNMIFDLEEARLQIELQQQQLTNLHEQIAIEEERNKSVTELVMADGRRISALTYSNTMATCCNVNVTASVTAGASTTQGKYVQGTLSTTYNTNPKIRQLAKGQKAIALLQSTQQAKLDGINSSALVKKLLLEEATIYVSLELAINNMNRQLARIEEQWKLVDRTITNFAQARKDLAEAYYVDPAYRFEASTWEQIAENDFATALEATYYATKALEYMWSEKYNNPILRLDGGMPEPLSPSYDAFQRAESIFATDFASGDGKSLTDFYSSLNEWDLKMRQARYPETQRARVRFSMRDDVLGYGIYSPDVAEAKFKSFINENLRIGESEDKLDLLFDFTMGIGDESLFPAHPNIKIESINLNLVSTASRSIRGSYRMDPALVDLVMLDRAYVRTFFSEYPAFDDIITYQLQEGRTIDKSPFIATVEASIDGYASPIPAPNTQLANHSPAVSQWMLRVKSNRLNNRELEFQYLSDIEMEIEYSYGKPRDIAWPLQ